MRQSFRREEPEWPVQGQLFVNFYRTGMARPDKVPIIASFFNLNLVILDIDIISLFIYDFGVIIQCTFTINTLHRV